MKQDIYVCFIDLRKAYDTINRKALIKKLYDKGISGKFLKSIKAMHTTVEQRAKINNQILPTITSVLGLKQGDNLSPIEFNLFFDDVSEIFDESCDPLPIEEEKKLSHLAFADDLAMFSLSKAGLQQCLNNLLIYCNNWGLEVSIKKTKVLVVNKSGKIPKEACFYYNNKLIETVNKFTYLGTLVTSNGSTGSRLHGKEELRKKADKGYFSLQKLLGRIKYEARLSLYLFSKAVRPILTYNCEILNQISDKKLENLISGKLCLENIYFESPTEKANLQICRNILGLSRKSSCLAVLGELGQFPVEIFCFIQMIKYWHRLKTKMNDESLISSFLKISEKDETNGHTDWLSTVRFILNYCDLDHVWLNPYATSTGKLARHCRKVLRDKFTKFFKDKLSNPISSDVRKNLTLTNGKNARTNHSGGNKLRTYNLVKQDFSMEAYLLVIKNKENRRNICKLRCGNTDLAIETGRLKKIPLEERVCTICENKVEDELHFLTECELFDIVREKFLNDIKEIDPNLKTDDRKLLFISLLTTTNCLILNKLSAFINACFEIRRIFKEVNFK